MHKYCFSFFIVNFNKVFAQSRRVIATLQNIYADGAFCENGWRLLTVGYFRENLYHRYLKCPKISL